MKVLLTFMQFEQDAKAPAAFSAAGAFYLFYFLYRINHTTDYPVIISIFTAESNA